MHEYISVHAWSCTYAPLRMQDMTPLHCLHSFHGRGYVRTYGAGCGYGCSGDHGGGDAEYDRGGDDHSAG